MIATTDGHFPEEIKIPADHKFYQDSVAAASAVANGRHSAEGGIGEPLRKRIILTRRVDVLTPDPDNPNAILWNPATAPFDEAWARLGIEGGVAAVVGGTETFGLFLAIGYDVFYLTRTEASVVRGRAVFPGRHDHDSGAGHDQGRPRAQRHAHARRLGELPGRGVGEGLGFPRHLPTGFPRPWETENAGPPGF